MYEIRSLEIADCEEFVALRRTSLLEHPFSFAAEPEDDRAGNVEAVREYLESADGGMILGAFAVNLVGFLGIKRGSAASTRHQIHLWGMYVSPEHRRHGLARNLIESALIHARTLAGVSWAYLDVTEESLPARRLYESTGFKCWGTQPAGFLKAGRLLDVYHLARPLVHIQASDAANSGK